MKNNNETMSLVSMILGICSLSFFILGWISSWLSLLGLACGIVAIVLSKKGNADSQSKTGFICGLIGTILSGIRLLITIILLVFVTSKIGNLQNQAKDLSNSINSQIGNVTNQVNDTTNTINEKTNEITNQASEIINNVTESINDTTNTIKDTESSITEKSNQVQSDVQDMINQAKDKLNN